MAPWSRSRSTQTGNDSFKRPLGPTELMFYWDAQFSGVSDTLQRVTVETDPSQAQHIFSRRNVERTWVAVKNLHPLIGAKFLEEDRSNVYFVVEQARLSFLAPEEIVFVNLQPDQDVLSLVDRILNEPRTLSNELLVKIWVIALPQRHGISSAYEVLFHGAHSVCDGMAQNMIIKSFFDILVHRDIPEIYIPKGDMESRLAHLLPWEDLHPARKYTLARQRWRLAIARVISSIREASLKGGHTLPRTVTAETYLTPVVSRTLRVTLTKDLSRRIIAACRKARITFGQALPILAQVAHGRILYRLYSLDQISDEEWEHRIKQPMHMGGPVNLRSYLDHGVEETGGADRVCVALTYCSTTSPFVPVPRSWSPTSNTAEPGFGDILSRTMFFHRCQGPQKQMLAFMNHPLLCEFGMVKLPDRIDKLRGTALAWRARQNMSREPHAHTAVRSGYDFALRQGYVLSNACSSFGNMDSMIPQVYPRERDAKGEPTLRLTSTQHYLRCRPTELYLTSTSYAQQIQLVLFCDVGVYEEDLAMRWLGEVGRAAEWYLGTDDTEMARL